MKKKFIIGAAALGLGLASFGAAPASAAKPDNPGAKNAGAVCVQNGLGTLKSLGLLQAAASKQIDYSTLADPHAGPIFADLPEDSFLSLGEVVKLHVTSPDLFAWCR